MLCFHMLCLCLSYHHGSKHLMTADGTKFKTRTRVRGLLIPYMSGNPARKRQRNRTAWVPHWQAAGIRNHEQTSEIAWRINSNTLNLNTCNVVKNYQTSKTLAALSHGKQGLESGDGTGQPRAISHGTFLCLCFFSNLLPRYLEQGKQCPPPQ